LKEAKMQIERARIDEIIIRHGRRKEYLLAMLLDCQEEFYHLPKEALTEISSKTGVPFVKVLSAATFFRAFSLKPVGKYPVHICMGTACHVKGAPRLIEAVERELGIKKGETTKDTLFSINTVNCLGCCGLAPVVTVGKDVHGKLRQADVGRILKKYRPKEA
jgi:NADH-quinone oxidoreductase subunit E